MKKKKYKKKYIWLLIPIIFLFMLSGVNAYCTNNYTTGNWIVNTTLTCSDETIPLNGNLTIESIGNLTFDNITFLVNNSFNGEYHVNATGRFEIKNSMLNSTNNSNEFTINAYGPFEVSNTYGEELGWGDNNWGLAIYSNYANITNCTFRHSDLSLVISGGNYSNFVGNDIQHNLGGIRLIGSGYNLIENNTLDYNQAGLVIVDDSHYNTINNNSASHNHPYSGINLDTRNNYNNITNNVCNNNTDDGISIVSNGTNNIISGNTIMYGGSEGIIVHYGVASNECTGMNTTIENNYVNDTLQGIVVDSHHASGTIINNNTIHNSGTAGILCGITSEVNVTNNTVYASTMGVYLSNHNNSEVSNNIVSHSSFYGMYVISTCKGLKVNNNNIHSNTMSGIAIFNNPIVENDVSVNNNTIYNNSESGILVQRFDNISILNNTIYNNLKDGIEIFGSDNNTIYNNQVYNNSRFGIYLSSDAGLDSMENKIYNNLFNNSNNSYINSTILLNYWNTTQQAGTRIFSVGTDIGGNYWTNSSGTGYSDICSDFDADGFCDVAFNLTTNNTDYLPLAPTGVICITTANGTWGNASIWDCGHVPRKVDSVFVNHTVKLNGTSYSRTLAILSNTGYLNGLNYSLTTGNLSIQNNATYNATSGTTEIAPGNTLINGTWNTPNNATVNIINILHNGTTNMGDWATWHLYGEWAGNNTLNGFSSPNRATLIAHNGSKIMGTLGGNSRYVYEFIIPNGAYVEQRGIIGYKDLGVHTGKLEINGTFYRTGSKYLLIVNLGTNIFIGPSANVSTISLDSVSGVNTLPESTWDRIYCSGGSNLTFSANVTVFRNTSYSKILHYSNSSKSTMNLNGHSFIATGSNHDLYVGHSTYPGDEGFAGVINMNGGSIIGFTDINVYTKNSTINDTGAGLIEATNLYLIRGNITLNETTVNITNNSYVNDTFTGGSGNQYLNNLTIDLDGEYKGTGNLTFSGIAKIYNGSLNNFTITNMGNTRADIYNAIDVQLHSWSGTLTTQAGIALIGKAVNISNFTANGRTDLRIHYKDRSDEADLRIYKYNGTKWNALISTVNQGHNYVNISNITSFSLFAIGKAVTETTGGGPGGGSSSGERETYSTAWMCNRTYYFLQEHPKPSFNEILAFKSELSDLLGYPVELELVELFVNNFDEKCPNFEPSKEKSDTANNITINGETCTIEPVNELLRHYIPIKSINVGELTCKQINFLKYFFNLEPINDDADYPTFLLTGIRTWFLVLLISIILLSIYKAKTIKSFLKVKRLKK